MAKIVPGKEEQVDFEVSQLGVSLNLKNNY